MVRELKVIKENDWSLNLEDPYYEDHLEEIFTESAEAVCQTGPDCYVNIVTPAKCGDPRDWLIPKLSACLEEMETAARDIRYIDQCGCGGYVTRVYR